MGGQLDDSYIHLFSPAEWELHRSSHSQQDVCRPDYLYQVLLRQSKRETSYQFPKESLKSVWNDQRPCELCLESSRILTKSGNPQSSRWRPKHLSSDANHFLPERTKLAWQDCHSWKHWAIYTSKDLNYDGRWDWTSEGGNNLELDFPQDGLSNLLQPSNRRREDLKWSSELRASECSAWLDRWDYDLDEKSQDLDSVELGHCKWGDSKLQQVLHQDVQL